MHAFARVVAYYTFCFIAKACFKERPDMPGGKCSVLQVKPHRCEKTKKR
jgi:hypothetical protein